MLVEPAVLEVAAQTSVACYSFDAANVAAAVWLSVAVRRAENTERECDEYRGKQADAIALLSRWPYPTG